MDARPRCPQLDCRERGYRYRLSLVLRVQNVRYLRRWMNGREVLACWEAVEPTMTIEPLRNLPVIRDLVVDRTRYEDKVASLEPWLERRSAYTHFPEPLTHKQMKDASKALDCISCMCCYSACPVIGLGDLTNFAGPAPLVQLAQTALDPRNDPEKVKRALARTGIFNCISCYKCEEVCPASIPIVSRIIEPLKAKTAHLIPGMAKHSLALRNIVANRGRVDPSALMLQIRGLRAFLNFPRIIRLMMRGKINPIKTFLTSKPQLPPQPAIFFVTRLARNEVCLLPRLFGPKHLRGTQRSNPYRGNQTRA